MTKIKAHAKAEKVVLRRLGTTVGMEAVEMYQRYYLYYLHHC